MPAAQCPPRTPTLPRTALTTLRRSSAPSPSSPGQFLVDIHYGSFGDADCGPIEKHGDFTAADGSTIHVDAAGLLCKTPGTVHYGYVVSGGTGRLRHAHGFGEWYVPAADGHTSDGGWGKEILSGSLHV